MENGTIVLRDRTVLPVNDGYVEVSQYSEDSHLIKGRAYVKDNIIYIYRGKMKKDEDLKPASIYNNEGKHIFVKPSKREEELYSLDKIISLNKDIIKDFNKDKFIEIDPEILELNDGEYFAPSIKPTDDILKKIIKRVLEERKINIRLLKDRFSTDYEMNNMKSALIKQQGSMSIKYFQKWCEILEIEISIRAKDISTDLPDKYKFKGNVIETMDSVEE